MLSLLMEKAEQDLYDLKNLITCLSTITYSDTTNNKQLSHIVVLTKIIEERFHSTTDNLEKIFNSRYVMMLTKDN